MLNCECELSVSNGVADLRAVVGSVQDFHAFWTDYLLCHVSSIYCDCPFAICSGIPPDKRGFVPSPQHITEVLW